MVDAKTLNKYEGKCDPKCDVCGGRGYVTWYDDDYLCTEMLAREANTLNVEQDEQ